MKISLKSLLSAITAAAIILMPALPLFAGNLDQPLAPTNPATAMFTVEDLYQRLLNGAAGTKRVGPFAEPSSGPTAGTRHTLDEIMGIAPALDNTNGAGLADVLSGKTFWGLTGTAWGPRIGTHTCPATATGTAVAADVLSGKTFSNSSSNGLTGTMPTQTLSDTNATVSAGYYNATTLNAVDSDLTAANIVSGKTIFGVAGTASGGACSSAPVPKTGQTGCWNAGGTAVACTGTGQDGDKLKGVAWPAPRFTEPTPADGTVTDNLTGLMWVKNANAIGTLHTGFDLDGTVGEGRVTWQHALDFVAAVNAGTYNCGVTTSYTDWRLPNRFEMESLLDLSKANPALPTGYGTFFTSVQSSYYWSATTDADDTPNAWVVGLHDGDVGSANKTGTLYVWPVR